ncbi:50S ribosomal protein L9 [Aquimarina brevivitae]|uniref:Large ribosomal subunit protein bL9 n=1 Tax=Aquimarina brevivitae TaxID=323412 RepID=A0A4Q7NU38_9FLAO|nr:50S ribosomal protein L9 [Aquimarina brevivitae]RZS90706.1 LSU ribosomal protein L9P [Aquimarina brevivitae]
MELILKKDVENLGFTDDIVEVKNGYGRNYLIPQGYAVLATPSAKKVLAETLKQRAFKEKKAIEDAEKIAKKINNLDLKITAKAGAGDKLFGSVSSADVSDELAKEGIEVEKKYINIAGNVIKRLGPYEADIRLHREVIVNLPFEVVAAAQS